MQEIIYTSFIVSNKFYLHGALACVYFLAAISTFLAGLASFFDKVDDGSDSDTNSGSDAKLDPLTVILPIIVFIFDCDVRRVYRKREQYGLFLVKLAKWALFYALIGISATSDNGIPGVMSNNQLNKMTNFAYLIWPCIAVVYSYCLCKFKFLSIPLSSGGNNGNNINLDIEERI